jgi:futalosine hydrolase
MKLLLVAATVAEIQPVLDYFSFDKGDNYINSTQVAILITGVGMVPTAFQLGHTFASSTFDLAINAGIAGCFDRTLQIGEVVSVTEDCFAELGAEDDEAFLSIDELGFGSNRVFPIHHNFVLPGLKEVKSITVNKVHGNELTIRNTLGQWQSQIESMEGAAFFYACNKVKLASLQIRAISNYVERRNRDSWKIGLAVKNLNKILIDYIKNL